MTLLFVGGHRNEMPKFRNTKILIERRCQYYLKTKKYFLFPILHNKFGAKHLFLTFKPRKIMKSLSKLLSVLFFSLLILSCQKESIEIPQSQSVLFNHLEVLLPSGYDPEILNYGQDDYERLFANSKKNARISGNEAPLNLSELTALLSNVKSKYPDLSKMEEKEMDKALKYFTKMDKKGINENREAVLDFFDKLISYDVTREITKAQSAKSNKRVASYPYQLNSCEFWWLINHPRFADKVEYATNKAFEFETQKFGSNWRNS